MKPNLLIYKENIVIYKNLSLTLVTLMTILLVLAGCSAAAASEPAAIPAPTGKIVLVDTSNKPIQQIERWQPLADYLAANLGEFGIGVAEVKIVPDLETAARLLASGEADLAFESPYPAMVLMSQSGSQPFVRQWKNGAPEYKSVIFTQADSGLTSLADLKGQMLALEDLYSTTGYMLPLVSLVEAGITTSFRPRMNLPVAVDEVGYVFDDTDENVISRVLDGKVAAGATDNLTFAEIPPETRANLTILFETELVPRQVGLARPGLDPVLQAKIKSLLMALDETEQGPAILQKFEDTTQFDELPGGIEEAMAQMQNLYQLIEPE